MATVVEPDLEEKYLIALLDDASGLDIAEFCWVDPEQTDNCYRAWDFQWPMYRSEHALQIDQNGRATGKTVGIEMRAFAFPFTYEGQEMLITAPELNHLRPITDKVESRIKSKRFAKELLPKGRTNGINRQPQWQCHFVNGARILSRLPNKDGKGVKGSVSPDALVLTSEGHVAAEDLSPGDLVLTHLGRWMPVAHVARSASVDMVSVDGGGYRDLRVSWNHRMIGRRNSNPQRAVNLEPATGVIVDNEEFAERWYLGSPSLFPATKVAAPDWCRDEVALAQLAGWYVAEGNQAGGSRVNLTVHEAEVGAIRAIASRLGLGSGAWHKHGKAWSVYVYGAGLAAWLLEHFGEHAHGKRVPVWLLGCDWQFQHAFLMAYLDGDGHRDERPGKAPRWMASTASRELAVGVRMLAQACGYAASMSFVDPTSNFTDTPRRAWRVSVRESSRNVTSEAGWDWQKVRRVAEVDERSDVITISVETDHSFVADGLLHHNIHSVCIEMDEGQDYPAAGWAEIVESRNSWAERSFMRVHGVSRGVRDRYYEMTQPESGFYVHRYPAMYRPSWSPGERKGRVDQYGGSRQSPDYRRNVYGDHGDATNPMFVLARLAACIDMDPGSEYMQDVYKRIALTGEQLHSESNPGAPPIQFFLDVPGTHTAGWNKVSYSVFYGGMDVGMTIAPSELLIFGQRARTEQLDLLLRLQMRRVDESDQRAAIAWCFEHYGKRLKAFGIDAGGVGFPIYQGLRKAPGFGKRIFGWKFDEKVITDFEDRELERGEEMEDLAIMRPFVEHASDLLRNEYVDPKRLLLPDDREIINQFQGQTFTVVKSAGSPYGKRSYSEGQFHALDAARMAVGAKHIPPMEARLDEIAPQEAVLDQFVGAGF